MIKIGILSSHNGSGYKTIHNACEKGILDAQVAVVISNNSEAKVLKTAAKNSTANFIINQKLFPNEDLDEKITNIMKDYGCDYIFLSGYMKKIEKNLITTFKNKIINSHPAILPNFGGKGMYGRYVHEAVIQSKETISGVTIHFVNENYDEGEYILQKSLILCENETVDSLEEKIKNLEAISIIESLQKITNSFK